MTRTVEEADLDFRHFQCCGDEDLYPFGCPRCGRAMVFCYECDTLYGDLNNLDGNSRKAVNHFDPSAPIFCCPGCAYEFEYYFIRDGLHKITFEQWERAGLSHLLENKEHTNARISGDQKQLNADPGGVPLDLNAGMIEAVTNPPSGFVSNHKFVETDVASRINTVDWFSHCGERCSLALSMEPRWVTSWSQAIETCKELVWENVQLEAQNQLTLWLHLNDHENYQKWNEIVAAHKTAVVNPITEKAIAPFQNRHGLDAVLVHSVQWDMLGAMMENSYMTSGHSAFFFLELLIVYEAGHFPCGWEGEWPVGRLLVF